MNAQSKQVDVSQFSRESARLPAHVLVERQDKERERLVAEKTRLIDELREIDAWKMDRALDITRRHLPKIQAIESTQRLEVEYAGKRNKVATQVTAIDERLTFLKARRRERANTEDNSYAGTMERIEALLIELVHIARKSSHK